MSSTKLCPRCGDSFDESIAFCPKDGARLVRGGTGGDLIGTVIAERYRVVSRIGEGGMGQVYLAEHVRMKRKSAIKIMRPSLVGEMEALQRFTREAENASQLSHPNIAAIFDFGETPDGTVYLAMEYIDGDSLGALLEQFGALHPDVVADILGQSADALQAAHDLQMLHRDIKPDNIMLGKRSDGTYMVKLVDFGIARTMAGGDQKVTRTGMAVGTPQYMSPEQLAGESLDARSDLYSLALVAFFALTGKQAFPAESSKESLIARLTSRPQTLQSAKEDVEWPDSLQQIFDKALAPEPHDRYETVSEFAHALSGAISIMTPTQTAELYRRALDVRVASIAARTPHSDMDTLRANSGSLATLGASSGSRESVSRTGSISRVTGAQAAVTGATSPVTAPVVGPPPSPRARWPFVIGAVVTVSVAATLIFTRRDRTDSGAAPTNAAAIADSAARVAVTTSTAPMAGASQTTASSPAATGRAAAQTPANAPTAAGGGTKATVATAAAARTDSVNKAKADAEKAKQKSAKDSVERAKLKRTLFPAVALDAAVQRGIDVKPLIVKKDNVRAVVMSTPTFVWRARQATAWKNGHPRKDGSVFDVVDPIERWSSWATVTTAGRAVYVLEVAPDRASWPDYAPDMLFDAKRGDIASVEVLRDGVPVALDGASHVPAFANEAEHSAAGKPVPRSFVAMLPPDTFRNRDEGSPPKIEIVVRDGFRNGAEIRMTLEEKLVSRLKQEFEPWRDALVRP